MVFEVFLDSNECFRWHLLNRTGEVIAVSAGSHRELDVILRDLAEVRGSGRAEIRSPHGVRSGGCGQEAAA